MEELLTKRNIIILLIFICTYFFGVYIGLTSIDTEKQKQKKYIQNIEEKLNIYEQSYEEFCLEDSLKQSDVYE